MCARLKDEMEDQFYGSLVTNTQPISSHNLSLFLFLCFCLFLLLRDCLFVWFSRCVCVFYTIIIRFLSLIIPFSLNLFSMLLHFFVFFTLFCLSSFLSLFFCFYQLIDFSCLFVHFLPQRLAINIFQFSFLFVFLLLSFILRLARH